MSETVIKITNLVKEYKMFARKKDRLMEAIFPNLVHKHGTFKAMDNFNLEVKKGEVLGILGKNGAGKSTLLKMITGVVVPTSGSIEVNGKVSSLLELGTAFNPDLTGIENIYQHGQVMGLTNEQIEEKKQQIIDFADIGEHLYQPVKTYSSGMFARLAFACAINVEPEVLIVDEVLSVGDMAFQLKCFKKFEQFKKEGKTILFVSHSVGDILRNCTRTVILENGRKIFDGDVKTGVDKYKKIMVGLDSEEETDETSEVTEVSSENREENWKSHFEYNEEHLVYGENQVDIYDYGIFDCNGKYALSVNNNEKVSIKMKVQVNEDIEDPIFALTFKDIKGMELCGTNTIVYRMATGKYKKGDKILVEFEQKVPLAPNKYTISLGCTKYSMNGELMVYQRRYDVLFVEVVSDRECVAMFDLDSKITYQKM